MLCSSHIVLEHSTNNIILTAVTCFILLVKNNATGNIRILYYLVFLIQKDGYLVGSVSDRKLNITKHWPVQFFSTVVLVILVLVLVLGARWCSG